MSQFCRSVRENRFSYFFFEIKGFLAETNYIRFLFYLASYLWANDEGNWFFNFCLSILGFSDRRTYFNVAFRCKPTLTVSWLLVFLVFQEPNQRSLQPFTKAFWNLWVKITTKPLNKIMPWRQKMNDDDHFCLDAEFIRTFSIFSQERAFL